MLAKSTVHPLVTLPEPTHHTPGALALCWWREFSPYENISQVFSPGVGDHWGEGHVLLGIDVTIQETLMAVFDHASNIR